MSLLSWTKGCCAYPPIPWWTFTQESLCKDRPLPTPFHGSVLLPAWRQWWEKVDLLGPSPQPLAIRAQAHKREALFSSDLSGVRLSVGSWVWCGVSMELSMEYRVEWPVELLRWPQQTLRAPRLISPSLPSEPDLRLQRYRRPFKLKSKFSC